MTGSYRFGAECLIVVIRKLIPDCWHCYRESVLAYIDVWTVSARYIIRIPAVNGEALHTRHMLPARNFI